MEDELVAISNYSATFIHVIYIVSTLYSGLELISIFNNLRDIIH